MDTLVVSWKRKNIISSLPQRSFQLVRRYNERILHATAIDDLSEEVILKRVQKAAADAVSNNDKEGAAAEYRCLETGDFLLPTVSLHPWYKDLKKKKEPHSNIEARSVLDLGCGMAADGRQMLADGFASTVIGLDRSDLYLWLGCDIFGDDSTKNVVLVKEDTNGNHPDESLPRATFVALDLVDQRLSEGTIVTIIQNILQRQQQEIMLTIPKKEEAQVTPELDAVYAGKFLHLLESESNLRRLLRMLWQLLAPRGVFFGIYGRNYKPSFECARKQDFTRVLTEEGFAVDWLLEEEAGATWFVAHSTKTVTA